MNIKVVTGCNYGDECKGMTAYALAKEAAVKGKSILSVLYNGGVQRGHTAANEVVHCIGTGNLVGGYTYYDKMFVVDPIALWITNTQVYIHPECRVVLSCDVIRNRNKELDRGAERHGSCGMGIFECVKRSKSLPFLVKDIFYSSSRDIWKKMMDISMKFSHTYDDVYNYDNMARAFEYMKNYCKMATLEELTFDEIIYEGGQGLLLDQANIGDFPHLTPSSVGSYNIFEEINALGAENVDVYYVSRSYMTRHGAGPMDKECTKDDINPLIVDKTNLTNEWQGSLRFGYLDQDKLYKRIKGDFSRYAEGARANLVFTQLNYTNGKLATAPNTFEEIRKPEFIADVYLSDQKDVINRA